MSALKATRTAQYVMEAEFTFSFDDTMINASGTEQDFGKVALSGAFDIINLPPGSVVVGGSVTTDTAFDTAGYDVIIGDATDTDRYMATADLKGAGTAVLVPTGYVNATGANLRLSYTSDDVCTTGKMTVRVLYITTGRANEVNPQ